jgi:hypothetical protein
MHTIFCVTCAGYTRFKYSVSFKIMEHNAKRRSFLGPVSYF